MNSIAIIPARGGSVRIPRKNIIRLNGFPAISYPIKACLESGVFERVIVSTEDDEIARVSESFGAEVIKRPRDLATNEASIHQVVHRLLDDLAARDGVPDEFCIVYATAVLLEPRHLAESYRLLRDGACDFVLAVEESRPHPYKSLQMVEDNLLPVYPEEFRKKSQFFPRYFVPAGAFHWMKTAAFNAGGDIWSKRRKPYILPPHAVVDLDEPEDIELASRLLIGRQYSK
jgi:pseudaminic acid cytidylyltransferase